MDKKDIHALLNFIELFINQINNMDMYSSYLRARARARACVCT